MVRDPLPFVGVPCMGAVTQIEDLDSAAAGHANTSTEKTAHFVYKVRKMGCFFAGKEN